MNFTNLSRYSDYSERTYRRQFHQAVDYPVLNAGIVEWAQTPTSWLIGAMDTSFLSKNGWHTPGLDWFYNGCASRMQKGLEVSVVAIVDVTARQGYTLSARQTPASGHCRRRTPTSEGAIAPAVIARCRVMLDALPPRSGETAQQTLTRIDHALQQLRDSQPHWPASLRYWAVDGWYAKKTFIDGVLDCGQHVISKLRIDANLRYLYEGPQKPRGAKRQYDGKVSLQDRSRWIPVRTLEPNLQLYTVVVWHVSLKRTIRLACLVDERKPGKVGYALLFSTDVELEPERLLAAYQARFQIEFIFREAKQFTGLCDAQTRDPKSLDFHLNASLTTLNLAKLDHHLRQAAGSSAAPQHRIPFSMASYKRLAFNDHLLERFMAQLDLNPEVIKAHPNYEALRSYGAITPFGQESEFISNLVPSLT